MNHTDKSLIEFANTINNLHEFGVITSSGKINSSDGGQVLGAGKRKVRSSAPSAMKKAAQTTKIATGLRSMNADKAVKLGNTVKKAGKVGAGLVAAGALGAAGMAAVKKMRKKDA